MTTIIMKILKLIITVLQLYHIAYTNTGYNVPRKKSVPNEPKLIGHIMTDLRQHSLLSMNKLPEIRNLLIKIANMIES